ncbi:hypothetical protein N788_06835 [Arenimonas donghaensis DSM 18148 = HO3-R19]|uniref:Sel1 repeat family protein n=2 Tax=Arenimonas TaxID=490567 RepID=A0A087MFV1_9GAMM|nr:hypothetical protein N788_06835 [Arenimonas donghaensis DSM 18148 = HO3-R19]
MTAAGEGEDLPPLPPKGIPIDQAAPLLAAHARAGHARAACRLALELLSCRFTLGQDGLRGLHSLSAERHAAQGNLEAAIRIDQQSMAVAESASACRRVEPALHEDAVSLLSQAARAGVPYAMYLYGTGEHYRYRDIGFAATPEFDQWRRSAPGMMLAARDAGIPEAAAFLARAYSQDVGLAYALFPDDQVQANAHWQLQSLLGSGATSGHFPFMFDRLDAAQERESIERARRWHKEAFASGVFHNLSSSDMPYFPGTHGSMASSDCQGPAPRTSVGTLRQAGD